MRRAVVIGAALALVLGGSATSGAKKSKASVVSDVQVWLTDTEHGVRLTEQAPRTLTVGTSPEAATIGIDPATTYQSMVGFGASLTDSAAWNIWALLTPVQRDELMSKLFDKSSGIGLTMLRQPMGASDFSVTGAYSYDDMPPGESDPGLAHFSIAHDEPYILPLIRDAIARSPELNVIATPWSPPGWMRQNGSMLGGGGDLKPEARADWAQYFVKFIQAYGAAGVPVHYITPQNEPLNSVPSMPSMIIQPGDEAMLIRDHLGPALASAGLSTKILAYDFTWDNPWYPETVLADSAAAQYVAGTAWHCYGGTPDQMTPLHDAFPAKDQFYTECTGILGQTGGQDSPDFQSEVNQAINSMRNWSRSFILWNIALNDAMGPSQGCAVCRGVVTVSTNGLTGWWTPTIDYYVLGQLSKFIRPGAVRVASNRWPSGINNVAVVNPDGSKALVAVNNGPSTQTFGVQSGGRWFNYTLNHNAAVTFTWTD